MTEPLTYTFEVACSTRHAFDVWTSKIDAWWPTNHTYSGEPDATVFLERRIGGRIFERTADGTEHEWGEVTVWQPPARLAYRWYLGRGPADATEVEIRFVAQGAGATRVEIEHRGWERLGSAAEQWRDRNQGGWASLLPHFITAINEGER